MVEQSVVGSCFSSEIRFGKELSERAGMTFCCAQSSPVDEIKHHGKNIAFLFPSQLTF